VKETQKERRLLAIETTSLHEAGRLELEEGLGLRKIKESLGTDSSSMALLVLTSAIQCWALILPGSTRTLLCECAVLVVAELIIALFERVVR